MSTLLEQAIIDAAALKETALKNAEATLIEKYSKEFKDTFDKLLSEQEALPADPTAAPLPIGGDIGMPVGAEEPLKGIPSAFLEGDDDEVVEINFDQLTKQEQPSMEPAVDASLSPEVPAAQAPVEAAPMMEGLEDAILDQILEMYDAGGKFDGMNDDDLTLAEMEVDPEAAHQEELEEELEETVDARVVQAQLAVSNGEAQLGTKKSALAKAQAQAAQAEVAQSKKATAVPAAPTGALAGLSEDMVNDLAERLKVDLKGKITDGYTGSNRPEEIKQKNVALAASRDDDNAEEYEAAKARVADLEESVKTLTKENKSLKNKESSSSKNLEEFKDIVVTLKEHIEQISVSNAKLLYTNKVLVNASLNERQKNNIVESISRAESVSEAKTIFETLQSSVQSVQDRTPKSLSEALNRGQSPFMARPKTQTHNVSDRMRILAGIKNSD
jgi:hypothetical protein